MTYTTKTLAKIGRIVIKQHPDIATCIIEQWPIPLDTDLTKIPGYFIKYCAAIESDRDNLKGEDKKIFVSAMLKIYADQSGVKKTICDVAFNGNDGYTFRILREAEFRYKKDEDFHNKVNSILQIINSTP